MNKIAAFLTTAMASIMACSQEKDISENVAISSDPLPDGAYLLSNVTITENGEVSVKTRVQIKIYAKGKFMYAFDNESTGDMDVGAGNANWSNGVMIEEPTVNHDGPVSGYSFDIAIEQTENGFEQILHGMKYDDGRVLEKMVEVWDLAPGKATDFDGLWKLQSRETDNPELTNFSETKMIGGGHFVILQHAVYRGKKIRNFGFGTFEINDQGVVVETGMIGSWSDYSDWSAQIDIKLIDENNMTQSFTYNDKPVTQTYIRI
jgi:hypothetical protein